MSAWVAMAAASWAGNGCTTVSAAGGGARWLQMMAWGFSELCCEYEGELMQRSSAAVWAGLICKNCRIEVELAMTARRRQLGFAMAEAAGLGFDSGGINGEGRVNRMEVKACCIRSYNGEMERVRVEDLERRCDVGPSQHLFFADTKGDPMCRIRNSPLYNMLVAEVGNELVGVIQGTIKVVTVHNPSKGLAKVGYILGLRVCPLHRRQGIASTLVRHLEDWFISNRVDYAYMATEKDNQASVNLFTNRLGFVRFRTPAILVQPVNSRAVRLSSTIEIVKLQLDQAESLYRRFMGSAEFFPDDIDKVLANKLTLGTWVAYPRVGPHYGFSSDGRVPDSWAMVSVWDSGGIFKLRVGKSTMSCSVYEAYSRLMDRVFPCFAVSGLPDFLGPFGFYFMYGLHREGPGSGRLVRALCRFVQNMAAKSHDCKLVAAEAGGGDPVRVHVPHWRLLSCPEDLWCIKALKSELTNSLHELTNTSPTRALFVDPREI